MVWWSKLVALLAIGLSPALVLGETSKDLNFVNYGLDGPGAASCGDVVDGFSVDKMYGTKCFPRRVYCEAGVPMNHTECPSGYTFISDDDDTCHDPADVRDDCGVSVMCGLEGITVHVSSDAVFGQTGSPLQFGDANDANVDEECQIARSGTGYSGTLSFDGSASGPTVSKCGIDSPVLTNDENGGDGYHIQYNFKVMRYVKRESQVEEGVRSEISSAFRVEDYDSESKAVITREKCFMVDVQCNYNPDGTVSSSYKPSTPNALDEHDNNELTFEMKPLDCADGEEIDPVTEYVGDKVCFVNKITTTWHPNIRISSTKCWVTPSSDPEDDTYYRLTEFNSNLDDTFEWTCSDADSTYKASAYEESFSFEAFRFQNLTYDAMQDVNSYAQTMHIHCDVNACDSSDTTSTDCVPHCVNKRRMRRSVGGSSALLPTLTKRRTVSKAIVMPKRLGGGSYIETPVSSYNLFSDTLSLGLFAVGCVFGIVALGMLVVLKRQNNNMKYRLMNNQ